MNNRFNNKRLIYLVSGLIVILILTMLFKVPREKATFKSKIVELDSAEVSEIMLYPRINDGEPVQFTRNANKWMVQQGDILSDVREGSVQNIFMEVLGLKPKRLAAKDKTKWQEFELTDSLATRIKFINDKGKTLADLRVGKYDYKPQANQYGGYGQNSVQITSYVRVNNENEVYSVEGFLPFLLNKSFNDWRNKTLIRFNKDDVTAVRLEFPADSGYILNKKDKEWFAGLQKADSSSVADYLNALSRLDAQDFDDSFKPVEPPQFKVRIVGNNLLDLSVKCYKGEEADEFLINSSMNPDIYYMSKKNGIFDRIFKPQDFFY